MEGTGRIFRLEGLREPQKGRQSKTGQVKHSKVVGETIGIVVVNCRSCVGKEPELQALIESTEAQIVVGTESWLKPEISSAEIFSNDLTVFRKDRLNTVGGGVFIAVRGGLPCRETEVDRSCEIVCIEVIPDNRTKLLIGAFYRPSDSFQISTSLIQL